MTVTKGLIYHQAVMTPKDLEENMTVIVPAHEVDLHDTIPDIEAEASFETIHVPYLTDLVHRAGCPLNRNVHNRTMSIHVLNHHYMTCLV